MDQTTLEIATRIGLGVIEAVTEKVKAAQAMDEANALRAEIEKLRAGKPEAAT